MAGELKYSCRSATETLEWIRAIFDFLRPYSFFLEAHVVNFFKDRLWEAVDKEWIECLRDESVENLLQIPSGVVQDYWPASLKEFVLTLRSLALPREQADLQEILPSLHMAALNNVLTLGMNRKKKHEVEVLAAVVHSIARDVGANTIVDVGAGQGYLAQVLSFEYHQSVIAIDACLHHGNITSARAERIRKHYASKMRKSHNGNNQLRSEDRNLIVPVPKTVTCRVLSTDSLKALSKSLEQKDDVERPTPTRQGAGEHPHGRLFERNLPSCDADSKSPLLLAGLHACGDLSVTMLRTLLECEEVKAVVSIGCCYNLLSEGGVENSNSHCGFPMSEGVKTAGLSLGRSSRDLACQSAERWRGLGKDAGLQNFELHTFRAAFQMVLLRYYPEILITSPAIGRQGKALRRQHHQRAIESAFHHEENSASSLSLPQENCEKNGRWRMMNSHETGGAADFASSTLNVHGLIRAVTSDQSTECEETKPVNKYLLFEKFSHSGLCRLGLHHLQGVDFAGVWRETEPFSELIGPYWSLRAALGPVLETILLLDRLLFLQEQGSSLEVFMLPIFDPALSPRNMALIAKKN